MQAVGNIIQAVALILKGRQPGDEISALGIQIVDQIVHPGDVYRLAGIYAYRAGIQEIAVNVLYIQHYRRTGLDIGCLLQHQVKFPLQHGNIGIVARKLHQIQRDLLFFRALANDDIHIRGDRFGNLHAGNILGRKAEIKFRPIPGIYHKAVQPQHPNQGKHQRQQRQDDGKDPKPLQKPPGAIG